MGVVWIQQQATQAPVCGPPRPQQVLDRAVRTCGLKKQWQVICAHRETVRCVARRYAAYLLDTIPDKSSARPLLHVCLEQAVCDWIATYEASADEALCYRSFIRGLLQHLPRVRDWVVITNDRRFPGWDPLEETMIAWWRGHRLTPRVYLRAADSASPLLTMPDSSLRMLVLSRFVLDKHVRITPMMPGLEEIIGARARR
ncbi:MAG: hypothetical protein ACR2RB_15970 [Gammaproteobacteria bacterium]